MDVRPVRRSTVRGIASHLLLIACLLSTLGSAAPAAATASYRVRMSRDSLRLSVRATLPMSGDLLLMDNTWPANIPEMDSLGWSGLVRELHVTDATGRELTATHAGANRWKLASSVSGTVQLAYVIDYSLLARRDWPAPREAAYADSNGLSFVGRSLFITTDGMGRATVAFELPTGWRAVTAWQLQRGKAAAYHVASSADLVENLCVLTRSTPDELVAGDFHLHVIALGHWQASRAEVGNVLAPVIRDFVSMMGLARPVDYLVVLLPQMDRGGESYRHSFALTVDSPPSVANRAQWGGLIAHEIFHLWNGWQLHGADYPGTQWFQEGFTEYTAQTALLRAGLLSPTGFLEMLSNKLQRYREIKTSLEAIGTHKGPPLYGGGALTAFAFDVMVRNATANQRSLRDFWRELLRETDGGKRAYAWKDLRAALERTAPGDWEGYYQSHVRGADPVPFDLVLPLVGLRLQRDASNVERIDLDPMAAPAARSRWQQLVAAAKQPR